MLITWHNIAYIVRFNIFVFKINKLNINKIIAVNNDCIFSFFLRSLPNMGLLDVSAGEYLYNNTVNKIHIIKACVLIGKLILK